MVRGPLPRIAVLGPTRIAQPELVKLQVGHIAHPVEMQGQPGPGAASAPGPKAPYEG